VNTGFFPLDEKLGLGEHNWTPQTIKQIVKLGVEIPSYRRAAQNFTELTRVGVSKSSLGELLKRYGGQLVGQQEAEATAMVKAPAQAEEVVTRRDLPLPDSEVMALSMDGAMVHIRGEGWKEVKTVTISAVEQVIEAQSGETAVRLSRHSYRSGLWDAPTFANQQWAEGCRRGLERAKQVVSVNDGAAWIWGIVQMCWSPCVEVLDWWHAVQKLWEVAGELEPTDEATAAWMKSQKSHLWHSQLRQVFRAIRQRCPRGQPLPAKVRSGIGYLFHHRHRLRYQQFREAGYPIGSGTVESACKLVMQERMKQPGMRWSREGGQAMLAMRAALLSDRWDEVWATLFPSPILA
jgi:hypothetical protein